MARASRAELAMAVIDAMRNYQEETSNLEHTVSAVLGIGHTELRCLGLLTRHGGRLTAGRLAQLSRLTSGAVTGVVDRLERAGLARREPDPRDRRRVIVVLDETAAARGDEAFRPLLDAQLADLERLSVNDLEVVRSVLDGAAAHTAELAARLKEQRDIPAR